MKPKVSICIPVYKELKYLRKTLDSIKMQVYKDYEIILTDDTPDDSVKQLVEEYNFYGKLKYVKNKKRKGSPGNWNEAVKHARGDYIKFLHHDDCLASEDSISEYVKMLDNNPDANFGFSSAYRVLYKDILTPSKKQIKRLNKDPMCLLFFNAVIGPPSLTIYRKNVKIYFDKKMKWYVDIDFYIRLLTQNKQFAFNSKPLVYVSGGSVGRVTEECQNSREINLFEFFYLFKKFEAGNIADYKYFKYIISKILFKYRVTTENEIIKLGVKPPLSRMIKQAIVVNKFLIRNRPFLKYARNWLHLS
ncbi:glycosyltransferase family 2 protein [candidate division KSB1 bacterium]|nr:glycosyltransferase family 2 protein [candidate division KSB1 bacterium]